MNPKTPCSDQSEERIRDWLRTHVEPGTEVVVRTFRDDTLRYDRGTVVRLGNGRFEVMVLDAGESFKLSGSFYYSGRSCWNTGGKIRLVMPTPEVLKACSICERRSGYFPSRRGTWICSFR